MHSTHTCVACATRGKTWEGSDPRCAFTGGETANARVFNPDNWNCATLNRLRTLVYEGQSPMPAGVDYQYCSDQKYATVCIEDIELEGKPIGLALWVAWYKSQGQTEAVWILDSEGPPRPPTEAEMVTILEHYRV